MNSVPTFGSLDLEYNGYVPYYQVFYNLYKVGRNGNFVFKGFNYCKIKIPVGLDLVQEIIS